MWRKITLIGHSFSSLLAVSLWGLYLSKRLLNMSTCFLSITWLMVSFWTLSQDNASINQKIICRKTRFDPTLSFFFLCCVGQLVHHHRCHRWDFMLNLKSILKRSLVHCSYFGNLLTIVLIAVVFLHCFQKKIPMRLCNWCCDVFFFLECLEVWYIFLYSWFFFL